jgi:hypothetical protein
MIQWPPPLQQPVLSLSKAASMCIIEASAPLSPVKPTHRCLTAAGVDGTPARGQSATSTRSVLTPADGSTTSDQPEGAPPGGALHPAPSLCGSIVKPLLQALTVITGDKSAHCQGIAQHTVLAPEHLYRHFDISALDSKFLSGADFEDTSARNQREAVASGERYVDKLNEELGKRAPMFVDDANFIRCACCAPGQLQGLPPLGRLPVVCLVAPIALRVCPCRCPCSAWHSPNH